jgi:hypothetical protein
MESQKSPPVLTNWLIFLGNMGGASERDRTSNLLIRISGISDVMRCFSLCYGLAARALVPLL